MRDRHTEVFAHHMGLSNKQTDTNGNATALTEVKHKTSGDSERGPEHNELSRERSFTK